MHKHIVVHSKGDQLEHVVATITEQQANQLITNQIVNCNRKEMINQTEQQKSKKASLSASVNESTKHSVLNNSLDGSQLKKLKQSRTLQQHLTLRIFRNFISCTFLIINSIIGCILLKSKRIDTNTVETALKILDPISAIISIVLLSFLVFPEVKQSGLILLQSLPSYIDIERLKRKLTKRFPMIFEIHEFHIWSLNTQKVIATCHIKLNHHFQSNEQFKEFFQDLQLFFKQEGIDQATIQPEFICANNLSSALNDENENALLQRVPSCLLKCTSSSTECEKNVCCHAKGSKDTESTKGSVDTKDGGDEKMVDS